MRGKGREKEREGNINVWLPLKHPLLRPWPGLQPRHVPWLGIEPETLWFTGQHSIHWATPARAFCFFNLFSKFFSSSLHSMLFCVSFKYMAYWLDNYIFYKVFSPSVSSTHPAYHTLSLTIFPILYFTSLCFVIINLYFLICSLFPAISQTPLPPGNHQSDLCIYESVSILFIHLFHSSDSTYKWKHKVICLLLTDYFT